MWKPELGGHRNAIAPRWVYCRVCDLIGQAKKAGPPTESEGWHLVLAPTEKHKH